MWTVSRTNKQEENKMATATLIESAQSEMRPVMDDVLRDVETGRNSLASPDANKQSFFGDASEDDTSRGLQRILDVMESTPERVAKFDSGKYVAQRNGVISYIYVAK